MTLERLPEFPQRSLLTGQEQRVLECLYAGMTNKEAARHLGRSPRTVEDHKVHILTKLGVRNNVMLTRLIDGTLH